MLVVSICTKYTQGNSNIHACAYDMMQRTYAVEVRRQAFDEEVTAALQQAPVYKKYI